MMKHGYDSTRHEIPGNRRTDRFMFPGTAITLITMLYSPIFLLGLVIPFSTGLKKRLIGKG